MPPQGRLGDKSQAPADAHGCIACPHPVIGPAVQGSPDVLVNGRPALRVGDQGVHAPCCGPNIWTAVTGSSTVLINNMPAHRMGDTDQHCGGVGTLIEGSPDVIVGDAGGGGAGGGATATSQEDVNTIKKAFSSAAERGAPLISRTDDCPCGNV